jgi:hypothetical protein
MINIEKILKRSWHILWNYRILWLFGILLALTGGGGGGGGGSSGYHINSSNGSNGSNGYNSNFQPGPFLQSVMDWYTQNLAPLVEHPNQHLVTIIWIGVAFLLFILVTGVITTIVRYVSETSIIRMVDEHEQSGTKTGFKEGWKLGWNRRAFRMWVIDLVMCLPVFLLVILLISFGVLFFINSNNGNPPFAIGWMVITIGCGVFLSIILIVLEIFLSLLRPFFVRMVALEGKAIGDSFRSGWTMFKRNWKSAVVMWLVMLGIGIGFGIAATILFFLLIPAYIILALPGAVVAAIPGAIAFGIVSIFTGAPVTWIAAALIALPFFLLVAFAPLTLISGWYQIYSSNVWTLTYREIKALETPQLEVKPAEVA